MTAQPEEVLRKVRQWANFAEDDLRLAEHALSLGKETPHRLVAYHAQQCAEKYLKAYLVHAGVDFPFTHNISLLLELCAESASWPEALEDAERLSHYAMTTRYPGEDRQVASEEARAAIEVARRVRDAVRADLMQLGADL